MRSILIAAFLGVVLSGPIERAAVAAHPAATQAPQRRTVYVSVTQKDGAPVTDLTAADFDVKEGGKAVEVVGAELTKTPIRLALIVADGGSGGFQYPLATLVQRLQEVAEFSLVSVINQPEKVVDFTTDLDKVVEGMKRLGARGTTKASGQVIEAIEQAAKETPQANKRPVIIVMTVGGSASTDVRADEVRESLRKTGTLLYAISPAGSAGGSGQVDIVLNDGSRDTGGRHERFNNQNLPKIAEQISQELLNQYHLSYTLPDGVKPSDRLEVTTKRKGVKVNAPSRIAS
jgi:VWFA-related protein